MSWIFRASPSRGNGRRLGKRLESCKASWGSVGRELLHHHFCHLLFAKASHMAKAKVRGKKIYCILLEGGATKSRGKGHLLKDRWSIRGPDASYYASVISGWREKTLRIESSDSRPHSWRVYQPGKSVGSYNPGAKTQLPVVWGIFRQLW